MILNKKQQNKFEALTRPIMKWLNDNCHPHVLVIVTPANAELVESVCGTGEILDYLKD